MEKVHIQDAGAKERKTLVLPCLENPDDFCRIRHSPNTQHDLELEITECGSSALVVLSLESQVELFEYLKKNLEYVQASEEGGASPESEPVPQLKKWRCTISSRYRWGTPGYKDFSARQGYCFLAVTPDDAIEHMAALFPNESVYDFTVEECL